MVAFFFILWNMASLFWSFGVDETEQRVKTYFQLGILTWMLWDLYRTPVALRSAMQAYVLGAYVAISSTVFNYLTGQPVLDSQGERFAGAGINAVELAVYLALGLPVAYHLATQAKNGPKGILLRIVNYAYIPASIFAMTLTGSRTALFAVLPMILYVIGSTNRLKPFSRIVTISILLGSLLILLTYIPQETLKRLGTTADSVEAADFGGRMELWKGSIAILSEHPFLGVGGGSLPKFSGLVAHNTFLSILAELGLIGFILFAGIIAIVTYQALTQMKGFSALWLTVLAIWAIGSLSLTWDFRKPTWLFFSLIIISGNLFGREDRVSVAKSVICRGTASRLPRDSQLPTYNLGKLRFLGTNTPQESGRKAKAQLDHDEP
jgi:O-antigen ligase